MSEGTMRWRDLETWYRVVGDLTPGMGRTPVVILHGGPGATHDYCEPIADLSRHGHACVLYDQAGNGRSTHRPDAPSDFWNVRLFKDEVNELTTKIYPTSLVGEEHDDGQIWSAALWNAYRTAGGDDAALADREAVRDVTERFVADLAGAELRRVARPGASTAAATLGLLAERLGQEPPLIPETGSPSYNRTDLAAAARVAAALIAASVNAWRASRAASWLRRFSIRVRSSRPGSRRRS